MFIRLRKAERNVSVAPNVPLAEKREKAVPLAEVTDYIKTDKTKGGYV